MSVPPIDPVNPGSGQNQPPYPGSSYPYRTTQLNILAVIGFALAVTGTGCGLVSLIISILGYNQINREPNKYHGKGFALAGILISIATFLLLMLLGFLGVLGAIWSESSSSSSF
ncbi:MAG: hypothetical protein EBS36_05990 [Actinobacteria bacterium]|nr:hypothetical protein [Actinomycetota bacterium]NBY15029.1 hypothetical protein [Actinomycetota bacterium]